MYRTSYLQINRSHPNLIKQPEALVSRTTSQAQEDQQKIAKMPSFDQKKAYAEQEEVFFDDGREVELLHYVFGLPELESIRGNPAKVLQAIDKFGREKKYLMNVGEDKGKIVTDLIAEVKPQTMVQYLIKTASHQRLVNHYLLQ